MTQYGATHRLLVEHEDDGLEDVELADGGTREAHVCRVFYYVEHPEDCLTPTERKRVVAEAEKRSNGSINGETEAHDPRAGDYGCPVNGEIENVGLMEALGVRRSSSRYDHLEEGTYDMWAWYRQYHDGDWDGGLEVQKADGSGKTIMLHETGVPKSTLSLMPEPALLHGCAPKDAAGVWPD